MCFRELTELLSGKVQVNVGFRQGLIQLLCGLIKTLFLSRLGRVCFLVRRRPCRLLAGLHTCWLVPARQDRQHLRLSKTSFTCLVWLRSLVHAALSLWSRVWNALSGSASCRSWLGSQLPS